MKLLGHWVLLMLLLVLAIGATVIGAAIGTVERRTSSPLVGAIVLGGLLVLWLWTAIYVVGGGIPR